QVQPADPYRGGTGARRALCGQGGPEEPRPPPPPQPEGGRRAQKARLNLRPAPFAPTISGMDMKKPLILLLALFALAMPRTSAAQAPAEWRQGAAAHPLYAELVAMAATETDAQVQG